MAAKYQRDAHHRFRSHSRIPRTAYGPSASNRRRKLEALGGRAHSVDPSQSTPRDLGLSVDTLDSPSEHAGSGTDAADRGRRREQRLLPLEDTPTSVTSTTTLGQVDSDGEVRQVLAAGPHAKRKRLLAPNPSTTRRGSAMVLLAVAGWVSVRSPFSTDDPALAVSPSEASTHVLNAPNASSPTYQVMRATDTTFTALRHPILLFSAPFETLHEQRSRRKAPLTLVQLVGRVSAWVCTLLYMTSRLPQIWTNYQRRSVQGLSLLLFVAAFVANALYSVSVLANPKAVGPMRHTYYMESLPFLLGSGGTLIFDLVIIVQWCMWHKRPAPASF